jgi:serine/threonine protein kinase, bacterial
MSGMRASLVIAGVTCMALTACSTGSAPTQPATHASATSTAGATTPAATTPAPASRPRPIALVTAERLNEVVALSLPSGRILRRVHVAAGPTTVAAARNVPAVVVSPGSGRVTLLALPTLKPIAVLRGFRSPQIATIMRGGAFALVTDDAAGTVSSIQLAEHRVVDRVEVGRGAHHLALSPDNRTAWVALGETATTIVVVRSDPRGLRVIRRLHMAVASHDMAFAPDGRTVWVTSATAAFVSVLDARTGTTVARVPAGRAPQHIVFAGGRAYIASGYGASIEMVDAHTHRVLRRARLPYGSFNLATVGALIVTTSLLDGRVTVLRRRTLRRAMTTTVAPNARAVAIARIG